ncbi:unnamed protein product [Rangifer tarandus platyrhynchus]|uniref:Uncharacterized protein n=1 Tax=Rangifer tarandus platyrhynchus TaxID=3082113 RepID=A0AC59Z1X1_RANTA
MGRGKRGPFPLRDPDLRPAPLSRPPPLRGLPAVGLPLHSGPNPLKNPPAMRETQIQPLGWEDPLDKEMATHSRLLAWKTPWMKEPGRLQSMGSQKVRHN